MGKSEREIIQDWFQNILKTWEKTNELEVNIFTIQEVRFLEYSVYVT